jgi:hypothetical protein
MAWHIEDRVGIGMWGCIVLFVEGCVGDWDAKVWMVLGVVIVKCSFG